MTEEELLSSPYALEQAEKSKKKALRSAAKFKPSKQVWAVIEGLEWLTAETIAILTERGQRWHDKHRLGEPMYSRDDGYQFVIHVHEIMQLYNTKERTAQRMLAAVRKSIGKNPKSFVTVKEWCSTVERDEEDFRKALRAIQPDAKKK